MPTSKLKNRLVERQTLADQVYASLKKAIFDGELVPGERLKELEIAESLGASRTPVREALSRLEQEGLVIALPSGGSSVVQLSETDVVEIFGLMKVLEGYAARLAAENGTSRQVEALEAICRRAETLDANQGDRLIELNRRFHEGLIEMANHRRLAGLIGNLRSAMQPYRIVTLMSPEFRKLTIRDHREMIEALRARDADRLVKLVREHLDLAEQTTLANVRDQARRIAAKKG